ncbi:MAG: aspartate aminotransferase family protein [Phycisphaerae bacterium]|nr:aspartate aminotransferase family protein [Phycisphaerae bacterium]
MVPIIDEFSRIAKDYLQQINDRSVFPHSEDLEKMKLLDVPLQKQPIDPVKVIQELHEFGSKATVASAGSRYFGFVIGGALPASLGANLVAGVWDQNAGIEAASPISSLLETICQKWLVTLLNLPRETVVGFVTGATMANFTCLAAARHALLQKMGWNVEKDGLFQAPSIKIVVGEEVHASVLKVLGMLGLGRNNVVKIPVDSQGRMKSDLIREYSEPVIICAQAGNVNTGAFDPIDDICEIASRMNAWVHIDGAFGLWANASPQYKHLCKGIHKANSWATDAHKWLNVPYDSGIAFVRDKRHLVSAMSMDAAYLISGTKREPYHYVPELSRRARGIEIWAALRSLGKKGLAQLIERNCFQAKLLAEKLSAAGYQILNDVVLNQILVSFGDSDTTKRVIQKVQEDGTCWCGGTEWQEKTAMRISVSSWRTTEEDIEKSANAIIKIAGKENPFTD